MAKKRVTSKMVAEKAGVSQTTVSFVLNKVKGQNISPETTDRVIKAAHDLGYVPDVAARMLARGVSDNVALVLTRSHDAVLSDDYVSHILTGIAKVFRKEAYRILVEFVDENMQGRTYLKLAHGKEAFGLLVIPYSLSHQDLKALRSLTAEEFPIVTLGKIHDEIHSVSIRDHVGILEALNHLHDMGHRAIATISYAPHDSALVPMRRLKTYRQFLDSVGIAYRNDYVQYGAFDAESGYQAMNRLLSLDAVPTAVMALNDVMAFGAMTAIRESGLRAPEDIAVVGYDGIRLARYTAPSLTTVSAPDVEQGELAAKMLLDIIEQKPTEFQHVELDPKLVIRDSCGYRMN